MQTATLPMRRVVETWWPLAASWLLMSVELPVISAVVARLADPEIHLASYGAVIFPIALVIEAPIIMLLAASTALSRDRDSYLRLRRFMMAAGAALTGLHILLAVTPLYGVVVGGILGIPEPITEAARPGFILMIPWTWSIAYRRFHQGVLIRFGHSKTVSVGTVVRLLADASTLTLGVLVGTLSGTVVATLAVIAGVVAEAVYIGLRARPVVHNQVAAATPGEPLTWAALSHFYVPLALTSILNLVIQPFGSAALSRMPRPVESLAVFPVVFGFTFLMRSVGLAYQEVVVTLLDEENSRPTLQRFAFLLTAGTTLVLLVVAATPLSRFYFESIAGLSPELAEMAGYGLWVSLLFPGLSVLKNWYQGILVNRRQTRPITESVVIFLAICGALLWVGAQWPHFVGLYVGLGAFTLGGVGQTAWVWWRSRAEKPLPGALADQPAEGSVEV